MGGAAGTTIASLTQTDANSAFWGGFAGNATPFVVLVAGFAVYAAVFQILTGRLPLQIFT